MKKLLLFICAVLIFGNLQAQTSQVGLKAGINYAGFVGDDAEAKGFESQVGLLGGISAVIGFTDRVGLRAEVLYSAKGTQYDADNQKDDDIKLNLNYIDVPILLNVFAGKFSLELGPQFGYLLSAKSEGDKVTDNFQKVDFGVVAGVNYMLDNGLNAGLRYNLGLAEVYNDDNANKPGFRNSAFQVTVGYMFSGRN